METFKIVKVKNLVSIGGVVSELEAFHCVWEGQWFDTNGLPLYGLVEKVDGKVLREESFVREEGHHGVYFIPTGEYEEDI